MEYKLLELEDLEPWEYRAEGNANIVIALPKRGQVLRLPKVKVGAESPEDDNWSQHRKRLEREVSFSNDVFAKLFGPEYMGTAEIVRLSPSLLAELNATLDAVRPAHRRHKGLGVPFATCRPDFTKINCAAQGQTEITYCVEIKPKKGWWTQVPENRFPKVCTFCLNQFSKLKACLTSRRSAYCPLDLFSGDPVRVVHALVALTQHPQNNFRIFRDGKLVYGDGVSGSALLNQILADWFARIDYHSFTSNLDQRNLNNFLFILSASVLKPNQGCPIDSLGTDLDAYADVVQTLKKIVSEGDHESILPEKSRNDECQPGRRILPEGCILSRVLKAQMVNLTSEPIYKIYHKYCPVHSSEGGNGDCCPSRACLVDDIWLDEVKNTPNPKELVMLQEYLAAATAKDCSLMITFCRIKDGGSASDRIVDLAGEKYEVKIAVADVDPKPLTSIARHFVAEANMVEAYHELTTRLPVKNGHF